MNRYRTWLEINEQALVNNLKTIKSLTSPGSRICAVIKANAYGHGIKEVARILGRQQVDAFAVDAIEDAITLRQMFPSALIIQLGYTLHEFLETAVKNDIELIVSERKTVEELEKIASRLAKKAHVHVKIDTGMSRLGVLQEFVLDITNELKSSPHVELSAVMTHFADTDDQNYSAQQFQKFQEAILEIKKQEFNPQYIHCAKSGAILLYPDTHSNLVRAGIIMYGLWPSKDAENTARRLKIECELTPILTWKTRIAHIKTIPAGTPVSYGMTETVPRATRVAVLSVGYFDGYDRKLSSKANVLINGIRCKLLGRVCMNMIIVDISDVPNAELGQEAILIGRSHRNNIEARELADIIGTIDYEVVTRINPLLPRIIT